MTKCPAPDKPRYADRLAALLAIEEHRRRHPQQTDDLRGYACGQHWHVVQTRAPAWRRAARRAANAVRSS